MPEKQPTKKQHYVPQTYLRGFSPDSTYIYEYNLKQGKPIPEPVSIESICREKFLYEFRDNDGEFIWINALEEILGDIEGKFAEYKRRLLSKVVHKENYKTKNFLSTEERYFWRFYTTLQVMRMPSILSGITEIMKDEFPKEFTENELRNIAIAFSLPFFKPPEQNELNAFLLFLSALDTRTLTVGFAESDNLFTSDQPMYGEKGAKDLTDIKALWFPISSNCILFYSPPRESNNTKRNRLIPVSSDEVDAIKGIAYMARNIVLSKHPFSEDDVEIIKQARADREQDKAFYYVASLVNRKTFIEQDAPPTAALSWQVWHLVAQTPLVRGDPLIPCAKYVSS